MRRHRKRQEPAAAAAGRGRCAGARPRGARLPSWLRARRSARATPARPEVLRVAVVGPAASVRRSRARLRGIREPQGRQPARARHAARRSANRRACGSTFRSTSRAPTRDSMRSARPRLVEDSTGLPGATARARQNQPVEVAGGDRSWDQMVEQPGHATTRRTRSR
jgi:hypothetical protein